MLTGKKGQPEELKGGGSDVSMNNQLGKYQASINLSQIVELCGNFGLVGVVAGTFMFRLLYRILFEIYVHHGMSFGALVGGVYVSSRLIDIGDAASMTLGAIAWSILFIAPTQLLIIAAELDAATLSRVGSEEIRCA
jgi:hypothetical protein